MVVAGHFQHRVDARMDGMNGSNGHHGHNGLNSANGTSGGSRLLWKHASPESTAMYQFLRSVNESHGLQLSTYAELHRWSIDHIEPFWRRVWEFVGVRAQGTAALVRTKPTPTTIASRP